jgi:hypothetical protein
MKNFLLLIALCSLAGCVNTLDLPVTGAFEDGSATLSGMVTAHRGNHGAGTLELTTSNGLKITGTYVHVTLYTGEGTFTCTNGKTGSFHFASNGHNYGTGTGHLGTRNLTFTFGNL